MRFIQFNTGFSLAWCFVVETFRPWHKRFNLLFGNNIGGLEVFILDRAYLEEYGWMERAERF